MRSQAHAPNFSGCSSVSNFLHATKLTSCMISSTFRFNDTGTNDAFKPLSNLRKSFRKPHCFGYFDQKNPSLIITLPKSTKINGLTASFFKIFWILYLTFSEWCVNSWIMKHKILLVILSHLSMLLLYWLRTAGRRQTLPLDYCLVGGSDLGDRENPFPTSTMGRNLNSAQTLHSKFRKSGKIIQELKEETEDL